MLKYFIFMFKTKIYVAKRHWLYELLMSAANAASQERMPTSISHESLKQVARLLLQFIN